MWNDLILSHEGPFETRDTKIATLRLKFNAFKALKGEKAKETYTRLKILLNELKNKDVKIPQAEVDAATNTITFILSCSKKPLSFDLGDFSTIIGLKYNKKSEALPSKETVRDGLATLGLVDEKKPNLTSIDLINSSLLRIRYFSSIWRVLMMHIVKCLGGMRGLHDHLNINKQVIAYNLIWGLNVDIGIILFSNLVVKLVNGKKGREPNICYTRLSKQNKIVAETQHVKELVATTDTTQSIEAFELTEEVANRPETTVVKKIRATPDPIESQSQHMHSYPISYVHHESVLGSDTLRFITPDVDLKNTRLCKDLQHPAHESQTLRVPELHSASRVTESQNKKNPKLLTFEGIESSPSVFLGQRTGDPSLHYKFTFLTKHLMQEHETLVDKNLKDPLATDYGIQSLRNVMEEAESNVESMSDDEILYIFGDDDEEFGDSENELYVVDEIVADNVIDELISKANTKDTHTIVFVASAQEEAACAHHEEHVMHDCSSIPTDAFMMIYDDMCEPHDQSVSYPSRNAVV
nr:hypothetical protein [Tanacetum cinerariifolium]